MNGSIQDRGISIGIGMLLVVLGVLFLLGQIFGFQLGQWLWPLFIIIPGVICFVGMLLGGKSAGGLAIPGSVVTTVGLILLYQNTFNYFESWAYAWALIPTAVGVGMLIHGAWSERPALVQNGRRVAGIGIAMFLIGGVFFELVIGIGRYGHGISGILWPALLIGAGIALLLRRARSAPASQPALPQAQVEATPATATAVTELAPSLPPVAITPFEPARPPSIGRTSPLDESAPSPAIDAPEGEETLEQEVGR